MLLTWIAVVVALVAVVPPLGAQGHAPVSPPPQTSGGVALPSIGLPLPSIGLPHPPMGLPPPDTRGVLPAGPGVPTAAPSSLAAGPLGRRPVSNFFFYPFLLAPVVPIGTGGRPGASASLPSVAPRVATGTVFLEIEPALTVQVYVDDFYVGETAGFGGRLDLEAGARRLEFRAPGHEPLRFKVYIEPDRSLTYRDSLRPLAGGDAAPVAAAGTASPAARMPAATSAVPAAPMRLYVIPGCYAGNVPPDDALLPERCDGTQAREVSGHR